MSGRIHVIAAIRILRSFAVKLWAVSTLPSPGEGQGNVAWPIYLRALKSSHPKYRMSLLDRWPSARPRLSVCGRASARRRLWQWRCHEAHHATPGTRSSFFINLTNETFNNEPRTSFARGNAVSTGGYHQRQVGSPLSPEAL